MLEYNLRLSPTPQLKMVLMCTGDSVVVLVTACALGLLVVITWIGKFSSPNGNGEDNASDSNSEEDSLRKKDRLGRTPASLFCIAILNFPRIFWKHRYVIAYWPVARKQFRNKSTAPTTPYDKTLHSCSWRFCVKRDASRYLCEASEWTA